MKTYFICPKSSTSPAHIGSPSLELHSMIVNVFWCTCSEVNDSDFPKKKTRKLLSPILSTGIARWAPASHRKESHLQNAVKFVSTEQSFRISHAGTFVRMSETVKKCITPFRLCTASTPCMSVLDKTSSQMRPFSLEEFMLLCRFWTEKWKQFLRVSRCQKSMNPIWSQVNMNVDDENVWTVIWLIADSYSLPFLRTNTGPGGCLFTKLELDPLISEKASPWYIKLMRNTQPPLTGGIKASSVSGFTFSNIE